jgi:transposase-like protein
MEDANAAGVPAEDLSLFCCQNRRCPSFGHREAKNLYVRGHVGKNRDIRLLCCRVCKKRFSENKGTIFYRARLPKPKIVSIVRHVQEGNGMRQTGRLEQVKEDTVIRFTRLAGRHARDLHRQLVAFSPSDSGAATG